MLYGTVKELYCHIMEHDILVYASHATEFDVHLDIHNAMHHIISHMMCVRNWINMHLLKMEISVSHLLRVTHSYSRLWITRMIWRRTCDIRVHEMSRVKRYTVLCLMKAYYVVSLCIVTFHGISSKMRAIASFAEIITYIANAHRDRYT
jgi:hypothetical protein